MDVNHASVLFPLWLDVSGFVTTYTELVAKELRCCNKKGGGEGKGQKLRDVICGGPLNPFYYKYLIV